MSESKSSRKRNRELPAVAAGGEEEPSARKARLRYARDARVLLDARLQYRRALRINMEEPSAAEEEAGDEEPSAFYRIVESARKARVRYVHDAHLLLDARVQYRSALLIHTANANANTEDKEEESSAAEEEDEEFENLRSYEEFNRVRLLRSNSGNTDWCV